MFGTTTLAEVKKKLIDRYGYLPDFSAKATAARTQEAPTPVESMSELERSLSAALYELERQTNRPSCCNADHAEEPVICFRENETEIPRGGNMNEWATQRYLNEG